MESRRQAAAVLAGIVLAVSVTVAVRYDPYTFIRRDASFYATITRGLVSHLSLDQRKVQPQSWYSGSHPGYANLDMYWSDISVGRNGTWYPKHSFLVSVAAVPFYVLFGVPGFVVFNALCVIAMLFAAYLLAVRSAPAVTGALAVLLIGACPTLVDHTYLLSADVFNATLIALGALALFGGRLRTAGVLLGIAIWARPTTTVLVIPMAAAGLWGRTDRKGWLRFALATAVPLAAAAVSNTVMYGAPWITSYHRTLVVENGVPGVSSHNDLFTNSLAEGYRLMFTSREHGLSANALPALLALLGLVPLARRDWKMAAGLALGTAGFFAVYIRYVYFNARFFFAWQVLLVIPLAALLDEVAALALSSSRAGALRLTELTRRLPRRTLWGGLAGAVAAALLLGLGVRALGARHYRLSEHVADAKVFRNDFPCDYFNMTHLAWECSRLDRSSEEYTGLALADRRCQFEDGHHPAILLGPPVRGGTRRIVFTPDRRGRLLFDYGLEAGGEAAEPCFLLTWADRPPQRLCAQGRGVLQHLELPAPNAAEQNRLEISIEGRGARALCFDGIVKP